MGLGARVSQRCLPIDCVTTPEQVANMHSNRTDVRVNLRPMKLTVQIRLLPNPAQEAALRGTLRLANDAANLVAEVAAGLPQGRERPRLPGPQVVPARHLRSDSTSSAASSRTRRGGSEWWSSGLTPPTPRRPARLAGTWTGTTEWIRPGSVAGRAASLSMPTGTQPATSPCVVQRAGLPSTSRTRTGAISPELQLNHSWFESLARPRSSCEPSRAPIHSLKSWPARLPIVPPGGHPRRPRKRGDLVEMRRWQERATGSRVRGVALALGGMLLLAGCAGGSYTGATEQAKPVHHLYMILFIVATVIFVLVEGLIVWAVLRYRRRDDALPAQFHGNNLLEFGWTLGQVINKVDAEASNPAVTVNVTGFQWQWEFTYAGERVQVDPAQPPQDFSIKGTTTKPPQIYLPVGETIHFNEQSKDVIHSLYIPEFLFKRDLIPGHTNSFQLTISKPGVYHGQCAQFCGLAHGQMHFYIPAVSRPDFNAWLAKEKKKAESGCPEDTTPGQIAAKNTAFDKDCLAEPANKAFTLTFNNQDAGIPHNVVIFKGPDANAPVAFHFSLFSAPATEKYQVNALPPGRYFFYCQAHPDAMTGTLVVK